MEQPDRTPDDAEIAELIGKEIAQARRLKGWSQSFLAKKVGLKNGSTIQRFEAGERCPGIGRLLKLTKALDLPVGRIIATLLQDDPEQSVAADRNKAIARALIMGEALTSSDPAMKELVAEHIEHLDKDEIAIALLRLVRAA